MTHNVGAFDRIVRLMLALLFFALPFMSGMPLFDATWATGVSIALGLIMLGTSAIKICPIYSVLGLCTCNKADAA